MASTCTEDETTLLISHRYQDDDAGEEEEALSLCDLPVNLPNELEELRSIVKEEDEFDSGFEFGIGSSFRAGSDSCEPAPEMSSADELFFKGRILPLRHSVSLDAGLSRSTRLITRSESVELRRTGIRSDRKIKNNFIDYSQPSPQPHIRRSSSMTARVNSIRNPKSYSIWDILRLGLVRTPEIELRTAGNEKLSVSRNSSCSSTSTSSNSKKTGSGESRSINRRRSFLFADCKCSVSTETIVPVKIKVSSGETKEEQRMTEKKTAKKEEKTEMARKRTFEWLKELSQLGFVVDHGRRSFA